MGSLSGNRLWLVCITGVALAAACKRSPAVSTAGPKDEPAVSPRDALCVEQPDGCIYCMGREGEAPFLETDQSRPRLCDPKDEDACVEFCSPLAPACALPWMPAPRCVFDSELEFHRAVFNRDTSDRPEVMLSGRVVDEVGHRLEGVRVELWVVRANRLTPLGGESSGKDGSFRLRLRSGPWSYVLRLQRAGRATEIVDRLSAERLTNASAARVFRMGPESVVRGRVVDARSGEPVPDARIQALRSPEETLAVGEARTGEDGSFTLGGLEGRRYSLRVAKLGWLPPPKNTVTAPAAKFVLKLARATVIRGVVLDSEGAPEPNATVAAVLSDAPGAPSLPIFWASDSEGRFAQDRFAAGTYYLWARRGDMLVYPPERIDIEAGEQVEVELRLSHKGASVTGQILVPAGYRLPADARVVLVSRSASLAFPRPAVSRLDASGRFTLSAVLPGRYELHVRDAIRTLTVTRGSAEVEVPIDPAITVALKEPLTVRAQPGE